MLNLNYNYVYFHTFIQDITRRNRSEFSDQPAVSRFHSAAAPSCPGTAGRQYSAPPIHRHPRPAPGSSRLVVHCAVTASSTACAIALAATLTSFVCGSVVISLILLPCTAKHRSPAHPPFIARQRRQRTRYRLRRLLQVAAGAVLPHRVVVRLLHHRRIVRRFTALLKLLPPAPAPPGLSAPSARRYRPACG